MGVEQVVNSPELDRTSILPLDPIHEFLDKYAPLAASETTYFGDDPTRNRLCPTANKETSQRP
jgi:hypothetical protein